MAAGRHLSTGPGNNRFTGRDILTRENAAHRGGALIAQRGVARNEFIELYADFMQKAASTPVLPWTFTKTGTDETIDFVSNTSDGLVKFTCTAISEAQTFRLDWADQLMINMSKEPRMECRLKIDIVNANFAATSRLVCGFASAYNSTLNNVVTNAWFRFGDGTNLKIFVEGDDGTTDTDLQDSGALWVDNTFVTLEVYVDSALLAHFLVDGVEKSTVSLAALGANTVVQPCIWMQRDSGTVQNLAYIDYVHLSWKRS